ncbi:MAG: hypothetical protein PHT40_01780 [Patescibacteria group bacterium]|nr:hypothetical protein [Patescibacteria group bacterium]
MKKFFLLLLFVLIVGLVLTACGKVIINNSTGNNQIIGGDKDEHGCLGSAGYSWCALKNKCLRIWEEVCDEKLTNDLRQAFADKYQKKIEDIKVTVSLATETHARGGVKFGTGEAVEGGNFLAAKVNDAWQIVFDGNGNIACALLRQYNFPANMMEDCAEE